jgi:hypothetical protein
LTAIARAYYAVLVRYHCSQCHHRWSADGEGPDACPRCKAEAGLEPKEGTPAPMRAFGLVLGGAIVLAGVGTALALQGGG